MDKQTANTNWGTEMKAIPLSMLRFVFAAVVVVVAIIQLITLYN